MVFGLGLLIGLPKSFHVGGSIYIGKLLGQASSTLACVLRDSTYICIYIYVYKYIYIYVYPSMLHDICLYIGICVYIYIC